MDGAFSARRRNHAFVAHRRDAFIEWIKHILLPPFELQNTERIGEQLRFVEQLVAESRNTEHSRLRRLVPSIGRFFTALPLEEAFQIYDTKYRITKRRFVPPSFNEIRQILNLSQVLASTRQPDKLQLVTFDGDQTLYADGKNFEDRMLANQILALLEGGCKIAVVTAASYADDAEKYETRLSGLLAMLKSQNVSPETANRFYVLGGECNFLFQLQPDCHLKYLVDDKAVDLRPEETEMLDAVEQMLRDAVVELNLKARVIRKALSCGVISLGSDLRRENLDECCLRMQHETIKAGVTFPFCAFNGGNDAWFDVGNKRVGIEALQQKFGVHPTNCLHVGDQLLSTGNDYSARRCSPVLWITSPIETKKILALILREGFSDLRVESPHSSKLSTPRLISPSNQQN